MAEAGLTLRALAIFVPWGAALAAAVARRQTRVIGVAAAVVSVVASSLLLRAAPTGASLG